MYLFLWIFMVYSFLGWCLEVSFFALSSGKFVNRGFLNGPVCPIYGFGMVIIVLCLTPLMDNAAALFLGSVLLTSLLELSVGFVLEKLFHQRWWDYTNEHFNLGGYICLRYSLAWGVACLLVVKILHPSILWLIELLPHTVGVILLCGLGVGMAADLVATVSIIAKINRSLGQIDELAARIKVLSNELGENLADRVLDAAEKGADLKEDLSDYLEERQAGQSQRRAKRQQELEDLKDRLNDVLDHRTLGQRRLLRAFPSMRSLDHKQALEKLRQRLDHWSAGK